MLENVTTEYLIDLIIFNVSVGICKVIDKKESSL